MRQMIFEERGQERPLSRGRRTVGPAVLLGLAALALAGCAPHPQTTLAPQSDYANQIQDLFVFTFWASVVVFVGVEGALILAIVRFRAKPGDPRPPLLMGSRNVELGWTAAPVLILAVIAVPTVRLVFQSGAPAPAQSLQVTSIGHQWWFEFQYPAQHIDTANEMHVILGQPVNVALQSADVIHSFWVPVLAGKRDMIPNHTNYIWFTPQKTGTYYGECAEFCGISHANMGFRLVVDTPQQFAAWVKDQQQGAAAPATAQEQAGQKDFQQYACSTCHTIGSQTAPGMNGVIGPNLTHFGSRGTIAAGMFTNTSAHLAQWLSNPDAVKPGNLMATVIHHGMLSPTQIADLAAYVESLK